MDHGGARRWPRCRGAFVGPCVPLPETCGCVLHVPWYVGEGVGCVGLVQREATDAKTITGDMEAGDSKSQVGPHREFQPLEGLAQGSTHNNTGESN